MIQYYEQDDLNQHTELHVLTVDSKILEEILETPRVALYTDTIYG